MRNVFLLALLTLSACGAFDTRQARVDLNGKPIEAIIQCAGWPDKLERLDDNLGLAEWQYKDSAPALSVGLALVGSVTIGGGAQCNMVVTFTKDGTVTSPRFPQCTSTIVRGPDAASTTLAGECLSHIGPAKSPAGYDAVTVLAGATKKP